MDVHRPRSAEVVVSPHLVQQDLAREHSSGGGGKEPQKLVLLERQRDKALVYPKPHSARCLSEGRRVEAGRGPPTGLGGPAFAVPQGAAGAPATLPLLPAGRRSRQPRRANRGAPTPSEGSMRAPAPGGPAWPRLRRLAPQPVAPKSRKDPGPRRPADSTHYGTSHAVPWIARAATASRLSPDRPLRP